ncbi:MAG: PoNe immunity protein domain-containing protein [Rectinemataceae bacterium]
MLKREPLMNQKYFDDTIAYMENADSRFEVKISDPATNPDHQRKLLYKMFLDELELLLTKYSSGYPIIGMREEFARVIDRRERHQKFMGRLGVDFAAIDDYEQSLWLVSLAILLNTDAALFNRVLACIGNEGKDKLFEIIVAKKAPGRLAGTGMIFPKPFQALYDASTANESDAPKVISEFLKVWYPSMGQLGVYWHDNHKGPEGGGFFGYWCLEAAAVVKAFGIDDSDFRDLRYYPKDLVYIA